MFWKKKQVTAAPVVEGATPAATMPAAPPEAAGAVKTEKLPAPRALPMMLEKHIAAGYKIDADIAHLLKVAVRRRSKTDKVFDCRVFDEAEAEASEVRVKSYATLDTHPELVLYEGWYDEGAKKVELTENRKLVYDVPLFSGKEIEQKIEALTEPGSSVFFYQNTGAAVGGPLGRGAVVIELNPHYPGKGKKYVVFTANVVGLEPVAKMNRLYESDKMKDLVQWIKQSHARRLY